MKTIKLTKEDIGNFYDLYHIIITSEKLIKDIKLNNMWEWLNEFHNKIEEIVISE